MKISINIATIFMFCLIALDIASAGEQGELISKGKALATSLCSDCHYVSREQKKGPILWPRAPSFASIANRKLLSDEELANFLAAPHASHLTKRKMPNLPLSDEYIEQLVAYIQSQRIKHGE